MNADQLIRNADLLLATMLEHADDLLATLPSPDDRMRLRDGLAALEAQARAVRTVAELLALADAVTRLVLSFPALQTRFLPDCIYRDALPEMLQTWSMTRQQNYIAKHKPGITNNMVDVRHRLDAALTQDAPPEPRSWWQRWLGRATK